VFQGTEAGIRIKSQRGRGNVVEGVTASNIVMQDVRSAFTITTFYHGSDGPDDIFPVNEGTPRFRDFHFNNITARGSATAGEVTGLREMPVEDITFSDVHIHAKTGMKITSAKNVVFRGVTIDAESGPPVTVKNSTGIEAGGMKVQ
jgi:polygalacturonase